MNMTLEESTAAVELFFVVWFIVVVCLRWLKDEET